MGDDGKPGEGAPSGPPPLPQLESYAVSIIITIHTVKFLGLSQKKLYNEFYAGNHLV